MLTNLIFMVDEKTELPVYENSNVVILRAGENEDWEQYENTETIWVCDNSNQARKLQRMGKNVIALLSEENSNQDFSFCKYAIMDAAMCDLDFFERILKRFLGLPWDILETDRCLVRETTVEDVDTFYELYKDKEITEYMEPLFEERDEEIEYTKSYIKNVYEFYGFGMWTVVEKTSGKIIGRAGVSYREGYELPELGFMIGKAFWRRGYAYEVCRAIANYMYENYNMEEILIFIEPQNTPSILLAKKLGAVLYKEQCMGTCDGYLMKLPL
ncbi:MAG: GNAT family N-acetyltransferase [Lachnospiraceae bacterium]|nr:GNAT family N-acetyltransferase [Lachnospiraceae bacterium]